MQLNTAGAIAACVAETGTGHVFAYPGDPIIELLEQLRCREVDVVLGRREGSAGFMAEGYAMATGGVGFVLSTLGPGATALVNPVAAATLDRVPIVAFSGQISTYQEYLSHQVVDHVQLFSPVTKWASRVNARSVGPVMRRALRLSQADRPGAVHLTVPADVLSEAVDGFTVALPPNGPSAVATEVHLAPGAPSPLELLALARRPIVLAGTGATRAAATLELIRVAETIGAPVVVSPMAKGVFPEDHAFFAGVLDMACNRVMWEFLDRSDLLLAVGFDAVELINPWKLTCPVIHVDASANTDQIYASECELIGDIGSMLGWVADSWRGQARWECQEVETHRRTMRAAYYRGRVAGHLNPTDVIDVVHGAAPSTAVVTTDVGSHKLLVGQGWPALTPRSVLMSNGLSSMGFGVPAAIGAALASSGRNVVALVGDGGFAMSATEVRVASAHALPVTFVVMVDNSLNRIELKQAAAGYPPTATVLEETDLVAVAEAMDCDGVRVSTRTELELVVANLENRNRPLVVEARIDPSQYGSQF